MMTCSGCRSEQFTGTIFCPICGASFLTADGREDAVSRLIRPAGLAVAVPPMAVAQVAASERELRAIVLHNGRRVTLPLDVPVLIGRADRDRAFYPGLDLANDGGYEAGVSRRHAQISGSAHEARVEDLQSGNGTFVNNQQVVPGTPHPLHVGDELRLGSIIMRIEAI